MSSETQTTTRTNTTAIARRDAQDLAFEPRSLAEAEHLAQVLAKSGIIPRPLQNRPADILVTLLTGRELGLGPMQSLRGIYVVDGKGVASADLIVALVKRSPACEYFKLVESTDQRAVYETKRVGEEPTTMSFTIAQARQAGLTDKQNWKTYPAAMLRARCSAALARAVYPDLAMGIYEHDEADEIRRETHQQRSNAQQRPQTQQHRAEPAPAADSVVEVQPVEEGASDAAAIDELAEPWLARIAGAADLVGLRVIGDRVRAEVQDARVLMRIRPAYERRLRELEQAERGAQR